MNSVSEWITMLSLVPTSGLQHLRKALVEDSPQLIQGRTVEPLPIGDDAYRSPRRCCPLSYALWKAFGLRTTLDVDAEFGRLCCDVRQQGGVDGYIGAISEYDEAPRPQAFAFLLGLVERILKQREGE